MASIYFKKALWEYKFKKVSHLLLALKYYVQTCLIVLKDKILHPNNTTIGILLAEHFGDIIAAEPIIPALCDKFPNAKIYWIVKPSFRAVLANHPHIHHLIEEKNLLTSIFLSKWNPFDQFYNLHLNDLRKDAYFQSELINEKAISLNILKENYLVNNNLLTVFSQLADLGKINGYPKIYLGKEKMKLPFKGSYWVINPKSNNISKEWPKEKWSAILLRAIEEWNVQIVELGLHDALEISHPNFISLVGKTTLEESMKIIQNASFFIGVDTGPTHCANAFQIPGLALFGNFVNFKNYQVFSGSYQLDGIATIYFNQNGPASELTIEEVWDELSKTYLKHHHLELISSHNL
ncbi:glycosyltransferase family 9 protein [Aquirufa sp. ROCK2-A2]